MTGPSGWRYDGRRGAGRSANASITTGARTPQTRAGPGNCSELVRRIGLKTGWRALARLAVVRVIYTVWTGEIDLMAADRDALFDIISQQAII